MIVRNARSRRWKNRLAITIMALMVMVCLVPLLSLTISLLYRGLKGLSWQFLTSLPLASPAGIGNAILGSLVILLVASCFAVPLGLLVGLFLSQRQHSRMGHVTRTLLDVMSGIPAIVVGMFVYTLMVRPMHGTSALAGGIALGIIMLPIFARTAEEGVKQIPATVMEAGLGLGLPRRTVIMRVMLRSAMPSVLTGFFLALARVGGEAAPLLFTVGGNNYWPSSSWSDLLTCKFLTEQAASLPVAIYSFAQDQRPAMRDAVWTAGLVLVTMILLIRLSTKAIIRWRYGQQGENA